MKTNDTRLELTSWQFQLDQEELGERDGWYNNEFDKKAWTSVKAPMAWDYYDDALWGYEGAAWYYTSVSDTEVAKDKRLVLFFNGVGGSAKIWVNGVFAGENHIRYLPFEVAMPADFVSGSALNIVMRVDNRSSEKKLPGTNKIEWILYGGITHSVELVRESRIKISQVLIDTLIQGSDGVVNITAELSNYTESDYNGMVSFMAGDICTNVNAACSPGKKTSLKAQIVIKNAKKWSIDSPNLYTLEAKIQDGDKVLHNVSERFGIREIHRMRDKVLVNGEEVFIKGVCYYDEYANYGTTVPEEVIRKELQHIKDCGANLIRIHYPQSPVYFTVADEIGLFYMPEVPINWWRPKAEDSFEDHRELANEAMDAVDRIARLYYNHPCWIIWSMSNESDTFVPAGDMMMKSLMKQSKEKCGNRLITWVCDRRPLKGEFEGADIVSVNLYYGLHHGKRADYIHQFDDLVKKPTVEYLKLLVNDYPDMPVLITEFGTVGVCGMYGNARLTEDFQAEFIKNTWEAIVSCKNVCGSVLWSWADYYHRKDFFGEGNHITTPFGPYGVVTVNRKIKSKPYNVIKKLFMDT